MPNPRKNQKDIAKRYADNRRYFWPPRGFRRARVWLAVAVLIVAAIVGFFYLNTSGPKPVPAATDSLAVANNPPVSSIFERFNSSGPISEAHAKYAKSCEVCHGPMNAMDVTKPAVLTKTLDDHCVVCHQEHTFHQADVKFNVKADENTAPSCTECHHEHMGAGPMQPVADLNCTSCHGSQEKMAHYAQTARSWLLAGAFDFQRADQSLTYFVLPRPKDGYTQVFQSFENKHPDFQIQREREQDPKRALDSNTLKFDHKFHLALPNATCADCHQPDSRGAYMQPITFAKDCESCHKLQVDPTELEFHIPHPAGEANANSVRDFLLDLPSQYRSFAMEQNQWTEEKNKKQLDDYVAKHMDFIRRRERLGADLPTEVFMADPMHVNLGFTKDQVKSPQALFEGCVLCHEVKTIAAAKYQVTDNQVRLVSAGEFEVTKPVTPDRWYVRAEFDHSKHLNVAQCDDCHGVTPASRLYIDGGFNPNVHMSERTSDINLPDKASCVICHSTKGGVVSTCATCHDYHNRDPEHPSATAAIQRRTLETASTAAGK